jgi:hypothetical protein
MKHLDNFEKFNEGRFKDMMIGGAIAGATLLGANAIMNPRANIEVNYTETDIAKFPEYYVKTPGSDENFDLTISEDNVLGTKIHVGKSSRYTITVNEGIDYVYYKMSSFGEVIYATTNKSILPKSERIDLTELEVVEETNSYKILRVSSFWSGLDFIAVDKNYQNSGNEFEIDGKKYTYLQKSFGFLEGTATFVFECK